MRTLELSMIAGLLPAALLATGAAPALAHAPYAKHRDGSWAQVAEDHHSVWICDRDRDRHRTFAYVWEQDNPDPLRTGYDSRGRDSRGNFCLHYRSSFSPVAYFQVCVVNEGCSAWTYVTGTVPARKP